MMKKIELKRSAKVPWPGVMSEIPDIVIFCHIFNCCDFLGAFRQINRYKYKIKRFIKHCNSQKYIQTNFVQKINFTSHVFYHNLFLLMLYHGQYLQTPRSCVICFCTFLDFLTDLLKFVFRSPYKRGLVRAELIPAI